MSEITFGAEVIQVRTMTDGAIRVTLDMPETSIPQMAMLAECKRQGIYLFFTAKTEINGNGQSKPLQTGKRGRARKTQEN